ncbi:MAG: ATP-binding protein [Candidatus Pacebacteria bacterium]|nr:ATP-binding protein [Candidatus Paceibacterota bacterium]
MIRKIIFSNFYSFKGKQEINFIAHKKQSYSYFNSFSGDQVSKVAGFIGKNASGKTNISRVLSFLSYFVCFFDVNKNKDLPYRTFFNNKETSYFEIEFEINDIIYFYDFTLLNNKVVEENLYFKEDGKNKKNIFIREGNKVVKLRQGIGGITDDNKVNLHENRSFISFVNSRYEGLNHLSDIFNFFASFVANINEKGEKYTSEIEFVKYMNYLRDKELKQQVEELLIRLDTGVTGFRIEKDKVVENMLHIYTKHDYEDKEIGFKYESTGTRHLLLMLGDIILGLRNNSVIILDEIDAFLHSELLAQLVDCFIDANEKGTAQLIFTMHDNSVMNYLDMHQNFIVDKIKDKSVVKRLCDIEGKRSDQNFSAKYAAGFYGSFPRVRL